MSTILVRYSIAPCHWAQSLPVVCCCLTNHPYLSGFEAKHLLCLYVCSLGRAQWGQLGSQLARLEGWHWNHLKAHSLIYLGISLGETEELGPAPLGFLGSLSVSRWLLWSRVAASGQPDFLHVSSGHPRRTF